MLIVIELCKGGTRGPDGAAAPFRSYRFPSALLLLYLPTPAAFTFGYAEFRNFVGQKLMQAIGSHFLRNAVHQALMRAIHKHYLRDARCQGLEGPVQGSAISVAQRFSSDLKLNLHWHLLFADGMWTEQDGPATFHPAAPLDTLRVQETLHDAVLRIDKVLKRKGWQERLDDPFAESEPALAELWKAALLGRPMDDSVALQNKAQLRGLPRPHGRNCAEMSGFGLHANTFVGPTARDELYKLVK